MTQGTRGWAPPGISAVWPHLHAGCNIITQGRPTTAWLHDPTQAPHAAQTPRAAPALCPQALTLALAQAPCARAPGCKSAALRPGPARCCTSPARAARRREPALTLATLDLRRQARSVRRAPRASSHARLPGRLAGGPQGRLRGARARGSGT